MTRLRDPFMFLDKKIHREKIYLSKGGWVMVACGKDTDFKPLWTSWEVRGTKALKQEIREVIHEEITEAEKRLSTLREFAVRRL